MRVFVPFFNSCSVQLLFWGVDGLIWRGMALSTLRVKGYEYFSRVEGFYFLFALASANFVGKGPRLG